MQCFFGRVWISETKRAVNIWPNTREL